MKIGRFFVSTARRSCLMSCDVRNSSRSCGTERVEDAEMMMMMRMIVVVVVEGGKGEGVSETFLVW